MRKKQGEDVTQSSLIEPASGPTKEMPITTNVIKEVGDIEIKLEIAHNELETAIVLLYLKEGSPDWL